MDCVPTQFACAGENRPVKIAAVGAGILLPQTRTIRGTKLLQKRYGFVELVSHQQQVRRGLETALKLPMHGGEVGFAIVSAEAFGNLANQSAQLFVLLKRQMTLVWGDRISANGFRDVNQIASGHLNGVSAPAHRDALRNRSRHIGGKQRGEFFGQLFKRVAIFQRVTSARLGQHRLPQKRFRLGCGEFQRAVRLAV
jgi:hypothetical protein